MKNKIENKDKDAEDNQQEDKLASDFLKDGWTEQDDGEVLKLEPGDTITGTLIEKSISHKYNDYGIYKIRVENDSTPKVILGSKQLDRKMSGIEENTEVKIVFVGREPTDKGQPMNVYRVFIK